VYVRLSSLTRPLPNRVRLESLTYGGEIHPIQRPLNSSRPITTIFPLMFEGLRNGLNDALRKLSGRGRLTEANIREGLSEVRRALLEADVEFGVVNDFIARVTEKATGQQVLKAINPSEQIIKFVYDELVALMGPVSHQIHYAPSGPTVLMLCGLQGSGKTTTCGKLALYVRSRGRHPMLVAADLQRPAAVEQLRVLGQQINVPVFSAEESNPVKVCQDAVQAATGQGADTIILDTAGRLHVDAQLMQELELIDKRVHPHEIFLVCDAMTGQVALEVAKAFHQALELDGLVLTKLDGDARGGAALSVKAVTGVPIRFIGVGEKLDKLEEFHPDRMAGRILGGGDIMTLVEKVASVQAEVDEAEQARQQERLARGEFTLQDFRSSLDQMKKLGSMKEILAHLPGGLELPGLDSSEEEIHRLQGIIDAMTPDERRNPDKIDPSRRRRIAQGAGTEPSDVNHLLKQFQTMRPIMKQMASMGLRDRFKALTGLGKIGAFMPGARMFKTKERSHRKSARERLKERQAKKRMEKRRRKK
jgi:signal recognition particle subunit SRP54